MLRVDFILFLWRNSYAFKSSSDTSNDKKLRRKDLMRVYTTVRGVRCEVAWNFYHKAFGNSPPHDTFPFRLDAAMARERFDDVKKIIVYPRERSFV